MRGGRADHAAETRCREAVAGSIAIVNARPNQCGYPTPSARSAVGSWRRPWGSYVLLKFFTKRKLPVELRG